MPSNRQREGTNPRRDGDQSPGSQRHDALRSDQPPGSRSNDGHDTPSSQRIDSARIRNFAEPERRPGLMDAIKDRFGKKPHPIYEVRRQQANEEGQVYIPPGRTRLRDVLKAQLPGGDARAQQTTEERQVAGTNMPPPRYEPPREPPPAYRPEPQTDSSEGRGE